MANDDLISGESSVEAAGGNDGILDDEVVSPPKNRPAEDDVDGVVLGADEYPPDTRETGEDENPVY